MGGKGGHGHAPLAGTATMYGRKSSLSPGRWDGATAPHQLPSPMGTPGARVTQGGFIGCLRGPVQALHEVDLSR